MYTVLSPNAAPASVLVTCTAFKSAASECTTRIPRPPPPAAALIITGKPIRLAMVKIASPSSGKGPSEPGTVGTPDFFIAAIAATLSPIMRMVSALGPINTKPEFSTCSAKLAFSAKKP